MKYYSLKTLLLFFEQEYNNDFSAIRKIVETFKDDLSDDETREILFKTLHESKMFEEGYEASTSKPAEIIMEPGTRESLAVFEQFEFCIQDKVFKLLINLN